MDIHHITYSSESKLPLFSTESKHHAALWALGRVTKHSLALFSLLDEHFHLAMLGSRHRCGRIAANTTQSLSSIVDNTMQEPYIRRVTNRRYMSWLEEYVLSVQINKHEIPEHPALWVGSCFQDLVGARVVSGLGVMRIKEVNRRFTPEKACRMIGLPPRAIAPADDGTVERLGPRALVNAAAAALAVESPPRGTRFAALQARGAAVHLAARCNMPQVAIAAALKIDSRSVRRIHARPEPAPAMLATRIQLSLRYVVAGAGGPDPDQSG